MNQNGGLTLQNPLSSATFNSVVTTVINYMIYVAVPLCTIFVLIGAFKMITSSGDPEKAKSGRNTILWAAIGFAVLLLAKGVSGFVQGLFKQ